MKSYDELIQERRSVLKSQDIEDQEYDSHQRKGVTPPPLEKPFPKDADLIDLVKPNAMQIGKMPLIRAIRQRESRRRYAKDHLTLDELSFLLYATQGVKKSTRTEYGRNERCLQAGRDIRSKRT